MAERVEEDKLDYHILRMTDVDQEPHGLLMPIVGYENAPIVSLEEAVQPLIPFLPNVGKYAIMAKRGCRNPPDNLTIDESASIMLYTMGWKPLNECLFFVLNQTLRSENRKLLRPWYLYLKLFLSALHRLPSISSRTVFRASKSDLLKQFPTGKTVKWWGFSSCTYTIQDFETDDLLKSNDPQTLFMLACHSGKDIKNHSYDLSTNEIILLPGTEWNVVGHVEPKDNLHIVHLQQIESPCPILENFESIKCIERFSRSPESNYRTSELRQEQLTPQARGYEIIELGIISSTDQPNEQPKN